MKTLWQGTLSELIELAKKDETVKNRLGANAAKRLYTAITSRGVKEDKTLDGRAIKIYSFFQDIIFGKEEVIDELMNVIYAAASGAEIGRNLIILVGPPGGGKSTIVYKLREILESETAYGIKGCPLRENPLKMIPLAERRKICQELEIRVPAGEVCPWCDKHYEEFEENWQKLPIEEYSFSERKGRGIAVIGTAQDPQEVDISELIGSQNLSKAMQLPESDPDGWDVRKSALFKANNGLLEIIEILKLDAKFHKSFSTICQEAKIDIPGIGEVTGLDLLIIGHTNQSEYNQFKTLKGGEWLRRRVIPIKTPHVLNFRSEEKIQKKLIEMTNFKKIHQSPFTYECLALLGILSRLADCEKVNPFYKAKFYAQERFEGDEDIDIKLEDIVKDGKAKNEGESGLDSTTINKMILFALGRAKNCLFILDLIDEIEHFLRAGSDATDKDRAAELNVKIDQIVPALKKYYKELIYKDVVKCFLFEHKEDVENYFKLYIQAVKDFLKEKNREPEKAKKDEQLMRRIEEKLRIDNSGKKEWRLKVLADQVTYDSDKLESFPKLKKAIEDIILEDVGPTIKLTLISDKVNEKGEKDKRQGALLEQLKEFGYCDICAKKAVEIASDRIREES